VFSSGNISVSRAKSGRIKAFVRAYLRTMGRFHTALNLFLGAAVRAPREVRCRWPPFELVDAQVYFLHKGGVMCSEQRAGAFQLGEMLCCEMRFCQAALCG